jgi:hypothetical protein
MKEVLSLATFALGMLCFVAFVTTVKPTAISAIQAAPTTADRTLPVCGDGLACLRSTGSNQEQPSDERHRDAQLSNKRPYYGPAQSNLI